MNWKVHRNHQLRQKRRRKKKGRSRRDSRSSKITAKIRFCIEFQRLIDRTKQKLPRDFQVSQKRSKKIRHKRRNSRSKITAKIRFKIKLKMLIDKTLGFTIISMPHTLTNTDFIFGYFLINSKLLKKKFQSKLNKME